MCSGELPRGRDLALHTALMDAISRYGLPDDIVLPPLACDSPAGQTRPLHPLNRNLLALCQSSDDSRDGGLAALQTVLQDMDLYFTGKCKHGDVRPQVQIAG